MTAFVIGFVTGTVAAVVAVAFGRLAHQCDHGIPPGEWVATVDDYGDITHVRTTIDFDRAVRRLLDEHGD